MQTDMVRCCWLFATVGVAGDMCTNPLQIAACITTTDVRRTAASGQSTTEQLEMTRTGSDLRW